MAITTEWYDTEKTIIRNIHDGSWTWNEFHKAISDIEEMLETVPHRVMIIVDISKSSVMPAGVPSQFSKLRNFWTHPKIEGAIMVGMSRFVQVFFSIFIKVSPQISQLMQTAGTLDEAEKLIQERRNLAESDK